MEFFLCLEKNNLARNVARVINPVKSYKRIYVLLEFQYEWKTSRILVSNVVKIKN